MSGLRGKILVADDDGPLVRLFRAVLTSQGHDVDVSMDGTAAHQRISTGAYDLVLVDLTLHPMDGLELLDHAQRTSPSSMVVIITGNATVETAVEALKQGAHDYLVKPVDNERLALTVQRALEMKKLGEERRRTKQALREEKRRNASLIATMRQRYALAKLTGRSASMSEVRALIEEVTRTDSTVLILGESGTGKSLLARMIHFNSHRAAHPFIDTNCAIYPEGVLMSELFGHESGAFTGATRQKRGRFELAEGGSVFLDEIGDIPSSTQVALLRFLQERRFERVGGEKTIEADVRVIAATNRDLEERIAEGTFREDLFYRLNVIPISLPPLRERLEDIPSIAQGILSDCSRRLGREVGGFAQDAIEALVNYEWPGNIREMENAIERAVLLAHGGEIGARHLPRGAGPDHLRGASDRPPESPGSMTLADNERNHILQILSRCRWNKKRAAELLGINRTSLYGKLRRLGIPATEKEMSGSGI